MRNFVGYILAALVVILFLIFLCSSFLLAVSVVMTHWKLLGIVCLSAFFTVFFWFIGVCCVSD